MHAFDERVLILAPTGRDGDLIREVLEHSEIRSQLCGSIDELCENATWGAGALFIAEEALSSAGLAALSRLVGQQPPWSDLPVIVSTSEGATTEARVRRLANVAERGNVVIVERPVRILTLVVTVQSALRARRRQYQMRDLSHQIEHEKSAAEAANRAKDEFLAMLGHELRNPLAPILTALELMRLRDGQPVARERAVIERQARHLATLVDDLLDVSRITRGKIALKCELVELAELIGKAVETAAPLLEQRRHALTTDVPARRYFVKGDPARLIQVFSNIISNAAKYTDDGGRIGIDARGDANEVVVRFCDTGRGISREMQPHVFDLFAQEHQNLDRSQGGLGLGLAIVKSLVEMHGGRVSVESAGLGHGSQFIVRLPAASKEEIAADRDAAADGPSASRRRPTRAELQRRSRVLLVDDNQDAATTLAEILETMGYATKVVHDGAEALATACRDRPPAAALLDIGLPSIDGYELARRLRELPGWRSVRLIAVTGYGQENDRRRSQEAGFDVHLVKPIGSRALEEALAGARSEAGASPPRD